MTDQERLEILAKLAALDSASVALVIIEALEADMTRNGHASTIVLRWLESED